jgi:hypothetical protein
MRGSGFEQDQGGVVGVNRISLRQATAVPHRLPNGADVAAQLVHDVGEPRGCLL